LKIETDNSATSYNLNRGAAAASLHKLTDRILKIAEDLNIQIHSFHIKGKSNIIPDSLSRLATSGDYSLKEEILHEALMMLRIKPTVDMFANRRNKKFRRFASLV
jgi:FAD/FMN-containing dehydrogenase